MPDTPAPDGVRNIQEVGRQAIEIVARAVAAIADQNDKTATADGSVRLFFPSGLEIIRLRFKIGTAAEVELVLAGKDAPQVTEEIDDTLSSWADPAPP